MKLKTHLKIDRSLSGDVLVLEDRYAKIELKTTDGIRTDNG